MDSVSHLLRSVRMSILFVCSLALLLNAAWPSFAQAVQDGSEREVEAGEVLSRVIKPDIQGSEIMMPAEKGTTVILFWATWSPRSKQALELWERFSDDYQDQPLTIITVNSEKVGLSDQDLQAVETYIEENIPNLPVVMDEGLALFNTYAVKALPTVFFLESSGELLYRYASFPTSATLDLQEELEITLGLRERQTDEEVASRGKLEYQPKNNALLHYNMAVQLYRKGYREKALQRMAIALLKDPEYEDPLRTLEGIYFPEGKTLEAETRLREFLLENGLDAQVDRIGTGEPIHIQAPKKIDAMERMRQLMEKNKPSIETSQ